MNRILNLPNGSKIRIRENMIIAGNNNIVELHNKISDLGIVSKLDLDSKVWFNLEASITISINENNKVDQLVFDKMISLLKAEVLSLDFQF
jgi:hypothetical protein